ncbi:hypothetical protein RJ640_023727 [Escallonia rubra]|uniref:Uncharacterized protein n=1 Tax=Escallonia rubra TaxID=112253 RepID=A0AA88UM47_9ASTE|nr:hypothetical protein RJ640_023727 [Escallonia rubra]
MAISLMNFVVCTNCNHSICSLTSMEAKRPPAYRKCWELKPLTLAANSCLVGSCNLFIIYSEYLIYHQDDEDNIDQGQRSKFRRKKNTSPSLKAIRFAIRCLNFFKLAPLFLFISLLPTSQLKPGAMEKTAVVMMFVILLLHYCLEACLAASVTNFTDEPALLAFKASIISDPNNILAKTGHKESHSVAGLASLVAVTKG